MPPYFHYLDTQKVGNGTVADIATRAFANLLTAAGKKKNVCVVVSDLAPPTTLAISFTAHSRTRGPSLAARNVASRRWTSPPMKSTTSCANASSRRFQTRLRSAISLMLLVASWKKPQNQRPQAAAPRGGFWHSERNLCSSDESQRRPVAVRNGRLIEVGGLDAREFFNEALMS
jgi:hypothetical protein